MLLDRCLFSTLQAQISDRPLQQPDRVPEACGMEKKPWPCLWAQACHAPALRTKRLMGSRNATPSPFMSSYEPWDHRSGTKAKAWLVMALDTFELGKQYCRERGCQEVAI